MALTRKQREEIEEKDYEIGRRHFVRARLEGASVMEAFEDAARAIRALGTNTIELRDLSNEPPLDAARHSRHDIRTWKPSTP